MNIFTKVVNIYRHSIPIKFISHAFLLYIGWYLFYSTGNSFSAKVDELMLNHLTTVSKFALVTMGYDLFEAPNNIFGILGSSGIQIGSPCNGISLMALFSGFIIAFPTNWRNKLLVFVTGNLFIHVLNILRIIALIMLAFYHRDWLEFNHDYTFTILVYLVTFFIWVKWVRTLNKKMPGVE